MPEYKSKRKTRRKYTRPRRRKAVVRRSLPVGGFPSSMTVKLRYCQHFDLDPAAGLFAAQVFRANSAFDPDMTGIGHQPSNFDRWAVNYDRYTVLGAKITITENLKVTTSVVPAVVAVCLSEQGTDISTAFAAGGVAGVLEQPRLSRSAKNLGLSNDGGPYSFTKTFSAKKFFGTNALTAEPYAADVAENPTEQAFFEVAAMSPDDSSNPGNISLMATIDYIVKFTEPKIADSS